MKAIVPILCIAFAASATVKTGGTGHNEPSSVRGSYTVEASFAVGLSSAYGLTVQDDVPNSIWICQWSPMVNNEFNMSTGSPTGYTWTISNGVDPDDQGYCVYKTSPSEFFFGDYVSSTIAVYRVPFTDADPYFIRNIDGPAGWQAIFGVAANQDNLYVSDVYSNEIAWSSFPGTESRVGWTTASFYKVSGMAVWEDYLFVCTQETGTDNIFIFSLYPDGSVEMTPIWSCNFTEDTSGPNGSLDYDGAYLWVYPQNGDLFKLDIDWIPTALVRDTWAGIKNRF